MGVVGGVGWGVGGAPGIIQVVAMNHHLVGLAAAALLRAGALARSIFDAPLPVSVREGLVWRIGK